MAEVKPCGTRAAAQRHRRHGEVPCAKCLAAETEAQRQYRNSPWKPPPPLSGCGTRAAYKRHRRQGETPCDACRQANNEYSRSWNRRPAQEIARLARAQARDDARYRVRSISLDCHVYRSSSLTRADLLTEADSLWWEESEENA